MAFFTVDLAAAVGAVGVLRGGCLNNHLSLWFVFVPVLGYKVMRVNR
jgi:hypothetical protein